MQGRPSPEATMHFLPPVSDFPLFPKKISDSVKNFPNFTFSRKISRFSSAKISDILSVLVINHKFRISPLFLLFQYISFPPISTKLFFPPLFKISPTVFSKFTCYLAYICLLYLFFVSPYFYYDAFMHHTGTGRP